MKNFLAFILIWLSFSAVSAQESYQRGELWQKEIDAFTEIDRRQTPPDNAVLFVGSSSIRMWTSLRADFPYHKIINRGFGGSHFEDVIHYAAQTILPYRPKMVLIYAGDNDITAGKTPERVFKDYQTLVSIIRQTNPAVKIAFISIKPSPSRREFWTKFQKLNTLVKTAAANDARLLYIDIWQPMLTRSGEPRREFYLADQLHMNSAGYAVWRAAVAPYLQ